VDQPGRDALAAGRLGRGVADLQDANLWLALQCRAAANAESLARGVAVETALPTALEVAGLVQDAIALYVEHVAENIAPVDHGAGRRRLERGSLFAPEGVQIRNSLCLRLWLRLGLGCGHSRLGGGLRAGGWRWAWRIGLFGWDRRRSS
jgi:hypothetical protein